MRCFTALCIAIPLRTTLAHFKFIEIFSDISGSPSSEECFNWPHLTGIPLKLGLCSL